MKKQLGNDYPNVTGTMEKKWIERFEKSMNPDRVERLFDYLEEKFLEISKKLDPLTEDLFTGVSIYSKNWKNFFQVNLEKVYYNSDNDDWEGNNEFPVAIEIEIADYYLNNDEVRTQEKLEDFLVSLPEDLDQALV